MLLIDGCVVSSEIADISMFPAFNGDESAMVRVMAWCRLDESLSTEIYVSIWRHYTTMC